MIRYLLIVLALSAAPATAEVRSATPSGLVVEAKLIVPVSPADAYAALGRIGEWWDSAHTYSGDARNMSIELRPGGCFCERIPTDGGAIEHGRVIYAQPGQTLRFTGGLGPLQSEAVVGTLTWSLQPAEGGTEITQTYVVGGYSRTSFETMAPLIDMVMTTQLQRLQRHLSPPRD